MFTLLIGLAMVVLCLMLQSIFIAGCLRHYMRFRLTQRNLQAFLPVVVLLAVVLLLMLVSNFVQMGMWAALFMLLGEFKDFSSAIYFSGVNFATLGYGDIIMSHRWRALGPMEAANGIMMFGLSTAVITAALNDVLHHKIEAND